MLGDELFTEHNPITVLLLLGLGAIVVPWLLVSAARLLARPASGPTRFPRAAPRLLWATAAGTYTWGLLHLFASDATTYSQACNAAMKPDDLVGYAPSFIPLSFGCRTSSGHTVAVVIPDYIDVAVAALVVGDLLLTGYSIFKRKETNT